MQQTIITDYMIRYCVENIMQQSAITSVLNVVPIMKLDSQFVHSWPIYSNVIVLWQMWEKKPVVNIGWGLFIYVFRDDWIFKRFQNT